MTTAIIYYSVHHGNTKKLLDAIAAGGDVDLIDVTQAGETDLSGYERVGIASGIYFGSFAQEVIEFAREHLPEGKPVFFLFTFGAPAGRFLKNIREVTREKNCPDLGAYGCRGFDTYGPLAKIGGIAKKHPTEKEIAGAVDFFNGLTEPCWIIDILPARVPAKSDGQYFAVERYYLEEPRLTELRKKQLDLMLKLYCYEAIAADFDSEEAWEANPSPERFAERFGAMKPGECFRFKIEAEDTMIAVNGDDLYMTMHHPSARMLKLVRALAHAEGLFVWKPEE